LKEPAAEFGGLLSEDFPNQLAGFQAGSLLAGYRLEAPIGQGGMAVVFRARDERLSRLVALKILAPALASDPGFRQRFISESRAAAIVDDPHIIPVYEAGEADDVLFIAMRFVGSGDLRQVLNREGPLAPDRAAEFVSQVASALDAAHRAGLVHRDVKPGNILVDSSADRPDHAYLSDFGISKRVMATAGLTGTGSYLGTAVYSAPEQIQGREVDGRTDQYALACVTYQLLTGTVPFVRDGIPAVLFAHLFDPAPSLSSLRPGLPEAADAALSKAMAKAPDQRYGTCQEFADALRAALGPTPYYPPSGAAAAPEGPQSPAAPAGPHTATAVAATTADRRASPEGRTGGRTEPLVSQRGRGAAGRLGAAAAWTARHRLPALALTCAVLVAVAVVSFVLTSQSKTPGPAKTPGPTTSPSLASSRSPASSPSPATSGSPASAPGYRPVAIDLPSPYSGNGVLSLAFSPSGSTLAIAGSDLCLWDIATTGCATSTGLTVADTAAFSPDGETVAVGDVNGQTGLVNVATLTTTVTFTDANSKGVVSVAFSPDGKTLATGDSNGSAYLWNVATRKLIATLTDPGSKGVASVAFSPDGKTLAAGDSNGRVYLWNTATGHLTATLTNPSGPNIYAVTFSPDGKTLATGDASGGVYLWQMS
jgi:Protein kinase domain/WD domain, G-beta repeat